MTPMYSNMKTIILFAISLSLVSADSSPSPSTATESTSKADTKSANAIPVAPQKAQTFYAMPVQHQQRPQYVQYVQQRPYYLPAHHQSQPTMVIIAQPALLPQHMLYSQAAQHLLNYFHSNPQARYQFLHGGYHPHPTVQPYVPQAAHSYSSPQITQAPYQPTPSFSNYQFLPSQQQQQQIVAAPQHIAFAHSPYSLPSNFLQQHSLQQHTQLVPQQHQQQTQLQPQAQAQHQQQPSSLSSISNYATLAAQQYTSAPIKTAPAIITGFENFTPEQQAQIKEQLSSHFGSQLTPISGNSLQTSSQYGIKVSPDSSNGNDVEKQDGQQQQQQQQQTQQTTSNYYRSQYVKA